MLHSVRALPERRAVVAPASFLVAGAWLAPKGPAGVDGKGPLPALVAAELPNAE